MPIQTIGILSPGDMGQAIAAVLNQNGLKTIAALDNRSERTRQLAAAANIQDVGSLTQLVIESDVILSVLVPAAATEAANLVAEAMGNVGKQILYVDCNAIAPQKVINIAQLIESVGGTFVDASIIGPPPRIPNRTRIYTSGKQAHQLQQLRDCGLDVRIIGDEIGQASGLKMSYAALTKGLTAISTELLIAAHRLGLDKELWDEISNSQKELASILTRSIPAMTPKAHRWVGEMEEIAETFKDLGLTERIFHGAADVYRLVKETSLGKETLEESNSDRPLDEIITILSNEAISDT
ncbi:6-phosphogluconate dehydrogenase [Nostoc sp. 'Peltigera membranacea cyanobiont' 213]|uniref:NAD(P)-dependent oxidoreductase n=1 Tax=unclassified Nostoc TaxID=2593658 RepID=UPI000B957E37|nr:MULTISPECIES: NAD(P)-dependent oxidoreductase [unclassified Nostoc]AVH67283.1 6-phosphogluconate dehydrogenase [Nostoc sp. 'Peltigera membranacea cyanobiont' N6]OYD88862.1 6-phosphogluconate dehydrogenase [Nostoc sp. 'Peltigera membranacea cyanobiont' 213]